ncbi:MAG: Dabb family protein [Alistipes sp.]
MLHHIVMWRFLEDADGKSSADHALWMKNHLEALRDIIPQIKHIEVGLNVNSSDDAAYDAVLISEFSSQEDLRAYKQHPAHVAISAYCNKVRKERAVVDYYA